MREKKERQKHLTGNLRNKNKPRIFAYCRISTNEERQSLERQREIINAYYPDIQPQDIYCDIGTGNSFSEQYRPNWRRLCDNLITGDTIIFSEVSRFSRNLEDGKTAYSNLTNAGVHLVFVTEPEANNDELLSAAMWLRATKANYDAAHQHYDTLTQTAYQAVEISLAEGQRENEYKAQRTREGMAAAAAVGHKAGAPKGKKQITNKSLRVKPQLYLNNAKTKRELEAAYAEGAKRPLLPPQTGKYTDDDCAKVYGVNVATVRKYRKEIITEVTAYANGAAPAEWIIVMLHPLKKRKTKS